MEPILSLKNVCSYYDKVQVLYDINVDVYPGEIVSVIGANGAGKSTMMKTNNRFCPFFSFLISLPLNASHFLSLHCSNFNFLLPRFSNLQNSRCSFGAQKAPAVSCRGCFCVTPRCTRSTRAPCPARRPCPRATPWRDRGRGPSRCSRGP